MITASAVDAESAEAVIHGKRNPRYLERYGLLFLTTFMNGLGDAVLADIEAARTDSVESTSAGVTTTTTSSKKTAWGDKVVAALGTVGDEVRAGLIEDQAQLPKLTVTVEKGQLIGVMLTADFTDDQD